MKRGGLKSGAGTKRVGSQSATKTTPRSASVGGSQHPSKGQGANKGRGTRFGV